MSSTSVTDALSRINAIQSRFQKYFSPSINSSTSEETATTRTSGDFSGDSSASTFSLELGTQSTQSGSSALANALQNGGNSSLGFSSSSLGSSLSSSLGSSLTSGGASLLSPSSSLNGLGGSSVPNAPNTPNVVGDLLTQQLQNQIQRSLSSASDRSVAGSSGNRNQIEIENNTSSPVVRSSLAASSKTNQAFPYEAEIREVAKRYDLPVALIRSVVKAESDFNPYAISSKGAMGLMQLMPETAQELGVSEPFDVKANLDGGTRYLRELSDQYKGDYAKILSAYNAGDAAVARTLEKEGVSVPNYRETQDYIKKVLDQYLKYSGVRS